MEYREDLFIALLTGLPRSDRLAVMQSIDHATDVKREQIRRSSVSEQQRLHIRRSEKLAQRETQNSPDPGC